MKTFSFKAFLRAVSIFGSVFLLKFVIEYIIQTNDSTLLRVMYSIGAVVIVALIFLSINLTANRLDGPGGKRDGNDNEKKT